MYSEYPLVIKYKHEIIPNKKTFSELIEWLEKNFDVKEIPLSEFTEVFIDHLYYNAKNSLFNKKLKLNDDDFEFEAYLLDRTEKNKRFYEKLNRNLNEEEMIYFIIEKYTETITSNSNDLFLRATIQEVFANMIMIITQIIY